MVLTGGYPLYGTVVVTRRKCSSYEEFVDMPLFEDMGLDRTAAPMELLTALIHMIPRGDPWKRWEDVPRGDD